MQSIETPGPRSCLLLRLRRQLDAKQLASLLVQDRRLRLLASDGAWWQAFALQRCVRSPCVCDGLPLPDVAALNALVPGGGLQLNKPTATAQW